MSFSSSGKCLTCFYENNNNEIGTINFNLNDLSENNSKPPKYKKNSGSTIIKSVLYNLI